MKTYAELFHIELFGILIVIGKIIPETRTDYFASVGDTGESIHGTQTERKIQH